MKTIPLWIFTISIQILLTACSINESTEKYDADLFEDEYYVLKTNMLNPENGENHYDAIGKMQGDILEVYFDGSHNHETIEEIYDEINRLIYDFGSIELNGPELKPDLLERITAISDAPEASLDKIISDSHLSEGAKTSLSNFIASLLLLQDEDYTEIYYFIVLYEASVIDSVQFNSEDKRVILTTSALVRHSASYKKRRKDKDWETSVGNIAVTVEGALNGSLMAVHMALVAGISTNTILSY